MQALQQENEGLQQELEEAKVTGTPVGEGAKKVLPLSYQKIRVRSGTAGGVGREGMGRDTCVYGDVRQLLEPSADVCMVTYLSFLSYLLVGQGASDCNDDLNIHNVYIVCVVCVPCFEGRRGAPAPDCV